ncbi:MAG: metallophosphoesterase family protein [Candidatus Aminicenantes bacterium]|nr:metallophosphoesterase family protein [Candidatus Aminicenantes bacterium]
MRYLVFSDIHSNLEAFEKFLGHKKLKQVDKILFLGDLVGYGPNPDEVISRFRELPRLQAVRGNHDKVIADLESSALFNPAAAFSAEWSKLNIAPGNFQYLKNLTKGPLVIDRFITICHGSTFDEDYYVFSQFEASESFRFMETSIGFFGHTHFPIIYFLRNEKLDVVPLAENTRIKLDSRTRYLINPGSIGQPRDKNPAASFLVFDSGKMEIQFTRFTYEVNKTQRKIREAGLPELLASRLEAGV